MRFVLISERRAEDYEESYMLEIEEEEYNDFEEVMCRYTLLCATRKSVLVIETENQRVVCQYLREGHSVFNRYLMDR